MKNALFLSLWLLFNALLIYLVVYIAANANERPATMSPQQNASTEDESSPSDDDSTHVFATREDVSEERERERLDEGEVRCPTCGQIQDAGFTFCEVCIAPLDGRTRGQL